jgi:uncharacterized membrane-anchored protein
MRVTLVTLPDSLAAHLVLVRQIMESFHYTPGQKYAEFQEGDKIAEYGLTALVVGGGAAVAAKAGVFKWLWKLILAAIAGIGAMFKKLFKRDKKPESGVS